jgi:hypothetical protein
MAKGKGSSGTIHKLHDGLSSHAPDVQDASRKISSSRSVNDGSTRKGVAVGTSEDGKDSGKLS